MILHWMYCTLLFFLVEDFVWDSCFKIIQFIKQKKKSTSFWRENGVQIWRQILIQIQILTASF